MDVSLMREFIDRSVRPGQPGGSLAAHRTPAEPMLTRSRPVGCNRYEWEQEQNLQYALYRRGRYGRARYLTAP